MPIWDVFGKRRPDDDFEWVGSIKASDVEMALVLATIGQRFHFALLPGIEVTPHPTFTLRPSPGIPGSIVRRVG